MGKSTEHLRGMKPGENCIQETVSDEGRPGEPLLRKRGPADPSGGKDNLVPSMDNEPTTKPPMPIRTTTAKE